MPSTSIATLPTDVPTRTPVPVTGVPTSLPTPISLPTATSSPDFDALAAYMMNLVNRDRGVAGVDLVAWDNVAALAAEGHAAEMAEHGYLSHWDLLGRGPEYRYWFAGGRDAVHENVYGYYQRYSTGTPVPIVDWRDAVQHAESALMDSPLHRANILDPAHTHLGIGIAYNPARGELRIAQEFVDRYVDVDPLPREASPGDEITVSGRILSGASSPLINLAYEPFPTPMTVEQLNQTGTYESAAQPYLGLRPDVQDDRFNLTTRFNATDRPGLYHVRTWVEHSGEEVLASDLFIALR
jgi:uncharacterized protein YkwD